MARELIGVQQKMTLDELLFKTGLSPNKGQLEILQHKGSPLCGIACAGSGKTTIILHKLLAMQFVDGIDPRRILAITFSRAAADEMKERHEELCKRLGTTSEIEFRTFHSYFYKILRRFINSELEIIDESERKNMLYKTIKTYIREADEEACENIDSLISYFINNLILDKQKIANYYRLSMNDIDPRTFIQIWDDYTIQKKQLGKVDFDDLQIKVYELLSRNKIVREAVQDMFDYYIIDEYQDISKIQLEIMKMVIKDINKLVVVGDDDQAIYQWRGSNPRFIVEMPLHFKNTKVANIEVNYRCPATILEPIKKSISLNNVRVSKQLLTAKRNGFIELVPISNNIQCAEEIVKRIEELQNNVNLSDIAVIYRTNRQPFILIDILYRKRIPFKIRSEKNLLYNYFIVNDLIKISQLAYNSSSSDAFQAVGHKIIKYLSAKEAKLIAEKMNNTNPWYMFIKDAKKVQNETITHVKNVLGTIRDYIACGVNAGEVIGLFLELYNEYLQYTCNRTRKNYLEHVELVAYLRKVAEEEKMDFKSFIEYISEARSLINSMGALDEAVCLTTMHGAKGLEFDTVFILNDSSKYCPNEDAYNLLLNKFSPAEAQSYLEEERRLHYVAWTRAKKRLIVTYDKYNPGRFLKETGLVDELGNPTAYYKLITR